MIKAQTKRIKNETVVATYEWTDSFLNPDMRVKGFSNFENKIISGNKSDEWFVNKKNHFNYHISWLKNIQEVK